MVKFRDICTKIGSGATPKGGKEAYCEEGITLIRSQNVLDFSFSENGLAYINDEQADKLKNVIVEDMDVLINITGDSVARTCMVDKKYLPARVNQHVCIVRANQEKVVPSYLLYILQQKKNYLLQMASGGATRNALTKDMICELEVELPSIAEQRKIVAILDDIQEKIKLNAQINNNLEEQAHAFYKSWFVDFEPFGGCMPKDWTAGKLKDILELKRTPIKAGENTQLPYLPIDVIPMHTLAVTEFKSNDEAQSSLITFDKDDILIGAMRVYFHRVVIAPCSGITRTTCFTLRPYKQEYLSYGLLCCNQDSSIEYAQTTSKGSTMPYAVWEGGLGDMDIVIPPVEVVRSFNEIVLPMIRQIQNSYFENTSLTRLRDNLLPRLMSGNLDVP